MIGSALGRGRSRSRPRSLGSRCSSRRAASAVSPAHDQRHGFVVRRARDAAVGGRRADERPAGQLPADELTRRSHVVRRRPHRLRGDRGRVLRAGRQQRRRRRPTRAATSTCPTSRARPRSCTTSRTAPAATVDYLHLSMRTIAQDLHGLHHELERPRDQRRQQGSRAARPADHGRVPQRPVGHDGNVLRLRRARRARPVRGRGRRSTICRPTFASSSSTARRTSRRRRSRSAAPTRSCSTSRAAQGMWSIGYDEFGYAKVYGADTAWVQNASGHWVQPYAENISAALESAKLRPDLSQELSGVYASTNPLAYPISAYSYLVTQCARRPTANLQGRLSEPGDHRDARAVDAVHRVRRPDQHGGDRLFAVAAQPVAGDGELDRADAGHARRFSSRRRTARTRASTVRWAGGAQLRPDPLAERSDARRPCSSATGASSTGAGSRRLGAGSASGPTESTKTTGSRRTAEGARQGRRRAKLRLGGCEGGAQSPRAAAAHVHRAAPVAYDRTAESPTPPNAPAWSLLARSQCRRPAPGAGGGCAAGAARTA